MDIKENILETIGNTPLLRLRNIGDKFFLQSSIFVKTEKFSPTGSIKDRAAREIVLSAISEGKLKKDSIIMEPTSGNMGISLSAIASSLGIRCIIFMPENCSRERILMMKALGSEVVLTPACEGMEGAIRECDRQSSLIPSSFVPSQFENMNNPHAHELTTGKEIYEQLDGHVDAFVCSFGTGGTISGVGRYLKSRNPSIRVIGVEPSSSPFMTKGEKGMHKIQGIGAGFKPDTLDMSVIDEIITVSDSDSYSMTRLLGRAEGILAGISSGCNVKACVNIILRDNLVGKNIVTVLPDSGERYLSVEGLYE